MASYKKSFTTHREIDLRFKDLNRLLKIRWQSDQEALKLAREQLAESARDRADLRREVAVLQAKGNQTEGKNLGWQGLIAGFVLSYAGQLLISKLG